MIDFVFNGKISVTAENKDTFIAKFNEFLDSQNVVFQGTINVYEFEDVEIIND